jgi:hypothetical protein
VFDVIGNQLLVPTVVPVGFKTVEIEIYDCSYEKIGEIDFQNLLATL